MPYLASKYPILGYFNYFICHLKCVQEKLLLRMSQIDHKFRNDPVLKDIVAVIKESIQPVKIYLFGSRVNETSTQESDYDLVVVVKDSKIPRSLRSKEIKSHLIKMGYLVDVFVYTQKEFNEWKDEFSSIPETAISTGYEVFNL